MKIGSAGSPSGIAKTRLVELLFMQFSQGLRQMFGLTATVQADPFLFPQIINCDVGPDSGMVLPCNEDHPVVEEFPVHERIKLDREPIDGDVRETVTKGRRLGADEAMIDGEAVGFVDDGQSDFHALLTKQGWEQTALVAFDLLRPGGDDLRQRPLEKRREALMRLVAKRRGDGILFSEALRRRMGKSRSSCS